MKNKIAQVFDKDKLEHQTGINFPQIHVIDLTERTKGLQNMEIHDHKTNDIDTLLIENPNLDISATLFKPQCFMDETGQEPDNCEGVFYLSDSYAQTWVLFIEIKDCKPKNVSNYHQDIKDKFIVNVKLFRDKGIIAQNKVVYAVASFPRIEKTNFHSHLIKASEWKQFRDKYKIMIKGTNEITIRNEKSIK
jgi:hypothetical protein